MINKDFIGTVLISIGVLVLLVTGFFGGRYYTLKFFKKHIASEQRHITLGQQLKDHEKDEALTVFQSDKQNVNALNDYLWSVPNSPSPFVGNAPRPGIHANTRINKMQFRSPNELQQPKPVGTYRIFFTGGSTAFGVGAPSEERTISGYLQLFLNEQLSPVTNLKYEVINAANPAWASTHERILVENRLSELDPDLVISFSGNNDVHWSQEGANTLWFRSYFDSTVFTFFNRIYFLVTGKSLPEVARNAKHEIPAEIVSKRLIKNIKLSSYVLAQENAKYLFVLQPTLAVGNKPLTPREQAFLNKRESQKKGHTEYFKACYQLFNKQVSNLKTDNFAFLNLSNIFDQRKDDIYLDSYHFGDKGNELIAKAIFTKLKQDLIM